LQTRERHAGGAPRFEFGDRKVRDANRADLAGPEQLGARGSGLGNWLRRGPVQLIEIDALDAQPAQARVALGPHFRAARGLARGVAVLAEAEFREHERAPRGRQRLHRAADDFLRPARSVDRRRVDPVDAVIDRGVNGRDAGGVVLPAAPHVAADGPRAHANFGDLEL